MLSLLRKTKTPEPAMLPEPELAPGEDTATPVRVYPFHRRYPGVEPEFHVACDDHPDLGFCGPLPQAREHRDRHLATKHPGAL